MAIAKAPLAPRRAARLVRWGVLSGVLLLVTVLGYLHQRMGVGRPVGVDALCPFGGLETLASLVADGTLIRRVALSSVVLLGASVLTAVVFGRIFCGRICPLGFLQEVFGAVGRRLSGTKRALPAWLDRPARWLKYAVLAVVIAATWRTGTLVVRPYDPWVAYQHLTSSELLAEFGVGLVVLGVALGGSLVYERFFCRYACPMGAFLSLISRFSLFEVRRATETCIDCGACDRACPTGVSVSSVETVTSPECIACGECVTACPVANTLTVEAGAHRRLGPLGWGAYSLGVFALLVGAATLTGSFDWTVPTLRQQMGRPADSRGSSDQGFDASLIRGSTTLAEVVDATGIPAEVFTSVYGVPTSEQGQPLRVLKDRYGCTPGDVRAFVTAYLADPAAAASWVPGAAHAEE
jgi:ferredoxin